jgi:uncharacterized protein YbjQ (UPF0145 family)
MPLFHRKSHEDQQKETEARAEADASLAALAQGGIPIPAQRRLDRLAQDGGVFSSDLSVNEFLLARHTGARPITQVMGSSVYHVGWQNLNWDFMSSEIGVLTHAYTEARRLALGRMSEEAERVGAHVVAGVRIEFKRDLGENLIEGAPAASRPALTNLSGQDFWKLYANGYWPIGVATGSTVFHAVNSWMQQMNTGFYGGWMNQELPDFTSALYQARAIALGRVQQEAMALPGAQGLVGVSMDQEQEEIEVGPGNQEKRRDMLFTFHVIGTCIGRVSDRPALPTHTTLDLRA